MEFNKKQEQALEIMTQPNKPISKVAGYAGVGKTTVLAEAANILGDSVDILAPTNKAAKVLKEKGIGQAKTIHSAIYAPVQVHTFKKNAAGELIYQLDGNGNPLRDSDGNKIPIILKSELKFQSAGELKGKTALVDEASMVDELTVSDIADVYDRVVLMGDDFQLKPVGKKPYFHVMQPDVVLDEVYRTALDNPITAYATELRRMNNPNLADYAGDNILLTKMAHPRIYESIAAQDAQVICWTNRTRHMVNNNVRKALGHRYDVLEEGDKMVCLENVRVGNGKDRFLKYVNGDMLSVAKEQPNKNSPYEAMPVSFDNGTTHFIWPIWHPEFFNAFEKDKGVDWQNECRRRKASGIAFRHGNLFDYSYCITAHKSQGSEWPTVVVFDQRPGMKRCMSEKDMLSWWYTAITRSRDKLVVAA